MEKGLHQVNQSINDSGIHNHDRPLLLAEKFNASLIDVAIDHGASSIDATREKSIFSQVSD